MLMRLYRLLSRVGTRKRRMYWWFKPPAAGAPMRYDGWVWDPEGKEWVRSVVEKISIEVPVPKYPKPTEAPRAEQPRDVIGWYWFDQPGVWEEVPLTPQQLSEQVVPEPKPQYPPGPAVLDFTEGWSWSKSQEEWVATIVMAERVGFDPPRSFPPNVDLAMVNMTYPMAEQYAIFYKSLIDMGLTETDARKIGSSMTDAFWNMSRSALTKHRAELYKQSLLPSGVALSDKIEAIGVYGAIIALAAIVGLLIGSIMDRIITPEEDMFLMPEHEGTYLMGPGEWFYSRNVGVSPMGNLYYSKCQGIGTDYVRHKRGVWGKLGDKIDFPGGFVESGFQFPYWVKYTWHFWDIAYIGMLYSSSEYFYGLKKEFISLVERAKPVSVRKPEDWCTGFDWYL